MKTLRFIILMVTLITQLDARNCPSKICLRREFRLLSKIERDEYVLAFKKLDEGPRPTILDKFTYLHIKYYTYIHTTSITQTPIAHQFLPYHRRLLLKLERELQKINPCLCLAYWKWSEDYHNEMKSLILQDQYFGSDGNSRTNCLQNGQFKKWKTLYTNHLRKNFTCLSREFLNGPKLHVPYNTDIIYRAMNESRGFANMSYILEIIHNGFHLTVGGTMASMSSSYDPFFWLHHTYIDKIWSDWQLMDNNKRAVMYSANRYAYLKGTKDKVIRYLDYTKMNYVYEDYKSRGTLLRDSFMTSSSHRKSLNRLLWSVKKLDNALPISQKMIDSMNMKKQNVYNGQKRMNKIIQDLNNDPNYYPSHLFETQNISWLLF